MAPEKHISLGITLSAESGLLSRLFWHAAYSAAPAKKLLSTTPASLGDISCATRGGYEREESGEEAGAY